MVVKLSIGGYDFGAVSYTVTEQATPLTAGDSIGSVGTIEVNIPRPDPDRYLPPGRDLLLKFGPDYFVSEPVELNDDRRGFIPGTVRSVSRSDEDGSFTFSCVSRMDLVNVYNITAKPFVGNLEGLFRYYLSLAGVTTGIYVEPEIAGKLVRVIGWSGELWYHLKMLMTAQECEITLVNGVITLRRIRTKIMMQGRDINRQASRQYGTTARAVEVYNYRTRTITNELVYPTGAWGAQDTEVLNVNAGEDAEYQLQLSASITSFQKPVMKEFVGPGEKDASVYTVVANDGLPVPPELWEKNGGRLSISINEDDSTSLTVKLRGASGIPTIEDGEYATNFSIALASDFSGNRYSTLRILGTGVAFEKELIRIETGLTEQETGTDVGVTVDNLFITNLNNAYQTGIRAAVQYAGAPITVSGSVSALGTSTVFGNVAGIRVRDKRSNRWYRVRTGTITPETIQFDAEDDLCFGDLDVSWEGDSFGEIDNRFAGMTFRQIEAAGFYG